MRRLLSGLQTRVDRPAEQVERQSAESVDLEELVARLDEGRRRNAAGIPPPRLTEEECTAWAEGLRASVRGRDDAVLVERLIAGRKRVMECRRRMKS
jgi:hypothetical protein